MCQLSGSSHLPLDLSGLRAACVFFPFSISFYYLHFPLQRVRQWQLRNNDSLKRKLWPASPQESHLTGRDRLQSVSVGGQAVPPLPVSVVGGVGVTWLDCHASVNMLCLSTFIKIRQRPYMSVSLSNLPDPWHLIWRMLLYSLPVPLLTACIIVMPAVRSKASQFTRRLFAQVDKEGPYLALECSLTVFHKVSMLHQL